MSVLLCLIFTINLAQANDRVAEVYSFKADAAEDHHPIDLANMQYAIYEAADDEEWDGRMIGKQKMELIKSNGDQFAKLIVDYTAQDFKIRLVESRGLGFDEKTRQIDGKFTSWMKTLIKDIQENLRESDADDDTNKLKPAQEKVYEWAI